MFVYVVGPQDRSQPWKIGRTTDPAARLKNLQAHSPVPLAYIKIVEAHPKLEGALHRQFAEHRIHGEWFNFPEEIIETLLARLDGAPWTVQLPTSGESQQRWATTSNRGKKGQQSGSKSSDPSTPPKWVKKKRYQKKPSPKKYVTQRDRRGGSRSAPSDGFRLDGSDQSTPRPCPHCGALSLCVKHARQARQHEGDEGSMGP